MQDTLENKPEDELDDSLSPANRTRPNVETEPGTTDMSEFEKEFAGSSAAPIVGNNLRGRENKPSKRSESADSLKNQEESPPDRSGFSAADNINEKLGRGYTGKGSTKSKGLSKLFSSSSSLKKKVAIAGAAAGGSIILGIIVFLAMLPLKIEHIMNNLDNHFAATSENALEKETENLYTSYVKNNVLPYLGKKGCHSTVDSTCVYGAAGSGPIGKLYKAWNQGRLEQKMANNFGIVLQKSGSGGGYTLSLNGHNYDIHGGNIFNLSDTHHASTNEVRQAVRNSLKEASLYDKVYTRFKLGKLLEAKYGIKRCIIACSVRDNFNDTVANKKLAAKAYLVDRVIAPYSDEYSLIIQCVIFGTGSCGNTTPDPGAPEPDENGNSERTSQFENNLQVKLDEYAAKYGSEKLADLASKAEDISKNGFQKYLIAQIINKAFGTELTSETVDKVTDPVSWLRTVVQVVSTINKAPQALKIMGYAMKSAAAAGLYMQYRDVADEMKSGHTDATELGSFVDQLSNVAKDDNGHVSDATATPLYNEIMGGSGGTTASILSDVFGGNAYADPTSSAGAYTCNNGKPVPTGQTVCPEEDLTATNPALGQVQSILNDIPGWGLLSGVASAVKPIIAGSCEVYNPVSWFTSCIGELAGKLASVIPGVSSLAAQLGKLVAPLFSAITNILLPSPFSGNMSGGRTFDMLSAGDDVSQNKACQVSLGCAQASDVAVAQIQNEQLAEQKQTFDSQSMFARMFDTNSSYSLVSRLAMDMPTSLASATSSGLASLITNPLSSIANGFSSIFSGNRAFAATPAQADPFGVVQNAYTNIPSDPDSFWSANCTDGPLGLYTASTDTLDISQWLSNNSHYPDPLHPGQFIDFTSSNWDGKAEQPNTQDDGDTGETYNARENPCLLIHATIQSAGGAFDPTLLPANSQNNDDGSSSASGTTTSSGVTGDAKTLAQKLLDEATAGKVVLTNSTRTDLQKTVQGQQVYIGDSAQGGGKCSPAIPTNIDPTLLQVLINISAQYKITIQNIVSGHPCDTMKHSTGHASDIFQINGTDLNDSWWAKPEAITVTNNIAQIEHDTDPTNAFGLGVGCSAYGKITAPSNVTVFSDSGNFASWNSGCSGTPSGQDEIHVDVRGGS